MEYLLLTFKYLGAAILSAAVLVVVLKYIREIVFAGMCYACYHHDLGLLTSFGAVTTSVLLTIYLDKELAKRFTFYFRIKNHLGHTVRAYLQNFKNLFRG